MNIYDEATIHQQARTDLLNSYGKYFNKQMYAELWNYTLKCEAKEERAKKVEELLDLYRLQQEFKERYNTQVRLLDRQETLDDIREIA